MVVCELCGEKVCSCKNKKPVRVRFCPACKSTDVKFVFKLQSLFGLIPRMECMKCGNHAPDFPVILAPAKKTMKKALTQDRVPTRGKKKKAIKEKNVVKKKTKTKKAKK